MIFSWFDRFVIVQLSLIEYSQSQYSVHSALLFLALAYLGQRSYTGVAIYRISALASSSTKLTCFEFLSTFSQYCTHTT